MMERLTVELTGSYKAVDDAGRVHVINIYTEITETTLLHGKTERIPGKQVHRLADGSEVRPDSDGTVTVLRSGLRLRVRQLPRALR